MSYTFPAYAPRPGTPAMQSVGPGGEQYVSAFDMGSTNDVCTLVADFGGPPVGGVTGYRTGMSLMGVPGTRRRTT